MRNYIRIMALSLLVILHCRGTEASDTIIRQSPIGQWLVEDKSAHIRIVACKEKMWGVVSWVNTPNPGNDINNPDVALRNRPILGLPILLGMQMDELNGWDGNIYNADNGKTYNGNISLKSAKVLHVRGCVLGILCGGEDWTRLDNETEEESADALCKRIGGV